MEEIPPRIITVGDSGVGKTTLIYRMKTDEFLTESTPTIGAGVTALDVNIKNEKYSIQVWDTAGQEIYRSIIPIYFKGAVYAILCFSMTDHKSFDNLNGWLDEIQRNADCPIGVVLVGNKYDCDDDKVVTEEEAQRYAMDHNMKLFFTSSMSGQNIALLLEHIAINSRKYLDQQSRDQGVGLVGDDKAGEKKKKGCC
ncbi:GTP-binding protein ypt3 [Tritrichomonas foetus]|uniref:GTP-binding protein ypt3 n=1 Tax=Tritrichomonas foetus TaxID=1144522 RepID=A0A1J4JVV3_9EUKA|nr:GTP-binding protein ypt3 [Tritrichomonas foetus]|eukprot:OHT03273.1 GTP-binding protein ypt3 [Tritrichomonas foetus]